MYTKETNTMYRLWLLDEVGTLQFEKTIRRSTSANRFTTWPIKTGNPSAEVPESSAPRSEIKSPGKKPDASDLSISSTTKKSAKRFSMPSESGQDQKASPQMHGPLGFTDMDPEGTLVEGFDQLSTMSAIYNYPYYPQHIESMGYEKAIDWVEYKIKVPECVPERASTH